MPQLTDPYLHVAGIDRASGINDIVAPVAAEELPAACRKNGHATASGIDVIRNTGIQRPLFLVHDIHGHTAYGAALAQYIDVDMPIYGLLGVASHEGLPRTLEALARRSVGLMRALQPDAPYRVAGLSFGGILAYEIAAQLIGEDREVEFLGLIDSVCPTLLRDRHSMASVPSLEEQLFHCCAESQVAGDSGSAIASGSLQSNAGGDFEDLLRRCRTARILPEYLTGGDTTQIRHHLTRLAAHRYAQQHYVVQKLPIPVHVFSGIQDSQPLAKLTDSLRGWDAVLPGNQLRSIRVSSSSASMLSPPHIAALGRALGDAIREATRDRLPRMTLLETAYCPHVSIQTGRRNRVPIFCVPGAGNSVTDFTAWAQAVGEAWPVHGLQPRGLSGGLVPHSTVQAAAVQYLRGIDDAHPTGPLHLVGHSFGGWVVLELAHLLRARGRPIASLTVMDGEAPDTQGLLGGDYTATEVLTELIDAFEMSAGRSLRITGRDLAPLDEAGRLYLLHLALVRVRMMPVRTKPDVLANIVRVFGAALRTTYRPSGLYPDTLRLVTVRDTRKDENADEHRRKEQVQNWLRWAPRLSCWHGPGNHMTMLDPPHVAVLADWWRSGLRQAGPPS